MLTRYLARIEPWAFSEAREPTKQIIPTNRTLIVNTEDSRSLPPRCKDAMLAAKITQAHRSKQHRDPDPEFAVNDRVMLATARRRRDYMQAKDGRVAKFMPRFDGPCLQRSRRDNDTASP